MAPGTDRDEAAFMIRWWRWHRAKRRLVSLSGIRLPRHVRIIQKRHRAQVDDFPPTAEGFERFASLWDAYADWFVPRYAGFLTAAGAYYAHPVRTVLDLACGTGLLTRRLATSAESVVGLDISAPMLQIAQVRTQAPNVRYAKGDFRDFALNQAFDAITCGSDSLNYVHAPGDLVGVFRCARAHMAPGGLLVFDVLDHKGFRISARRKVVATVNDKRFEVYFFYDPECRVSEARVVLEDMVERHRRVPIEENDVRDAAQIAGLNVADHFGANRWLGHARQFYVLRRGD